MLGQREHMRIFSLKGSVLAIVDALGLLGCLACLLAESINLNFSISDHYYQRLNSKSH